MMTMALQRGWRPAPLRLRAFVVMLGLVLSIGPVWAERATVRDAGTLTLGEVTYRLDGIDAPAIDQMCIDDHADPWACGGAARDHLVSLLGDREVHCEDLGPDKTFAKRHVAICTLDDKTSLNQLLVRHGFALSLGPKNAFSADETGAKNDRQGLWKGCFAAPQEYRHKQNTGTALLGGACRTDKDREIRAVVFPTDPDMPPGCSVKAKFALRARLTGNVGLYQLQGCRRYPDMVKPDRWFCSEDDAQAAGFRRAYNCRAPAKK
jgi:endonuclease YncB( thermonuclease family)